jgi:hypothetical protein
MTGKMDQPMNLELSHEVACLFIQAKHCDKGIRSSIATSMLETDGEHLSVKNIKAGCTEEHPCCLKNK